jgi:hypothetical protein
LLFESQPGIIDRSERRLSFADLKQFDDIEDARNYLVEDEINILMRENHLKQFDHLDKRIGYRYPSDDYLFRSFIEVTETRNLVVHTDGIVSKQYIDSCRSNGVKLPCGISAGDRRIITKEYFLQSCDCLIEMAVKTGHGLWRKLQPDQGDFQGNHYNTVAYTLVRDEQYQLAVNLLEFSLRKETNYVNGASRMSARINLAQAYKWAGDVKKCLEILEQ